MLVGIVKKNAIRQIDFAQEAIYQGCLIRFRLIMMTTMAAAQEWFRERKRAPKAQCPTGP